VVISLQQGVSALHMVQLMPLPLHHLLLHQNPEWFLPFWFQVTHVVLAKRPLNGCLFAFNATLNKKASIR